MNALASVKCAKCQLKTVMEDTPTSIALHGLFLTDTVLTSFEICQVCFRKYIVPRDTNRYGRNPQQETVAQRWFAALLEKLSPKDLRRLHKVRREFLRLLAPFDFDAEASARVAEEAFHWFVTAGHDKLPMPPKDD